MAKLVAKIVTAVVFTRVIVSEDATDEQVQRLAKSRLLDNLDNEYEDNIEDIKLDLESPYVEGEEDKSTPYLDVYASIDIETWKKKEYDIMSYSVDGVNYNDNEHRLTHDDDYSVNLRILKRDFVAFSMFTNSCNATPVLFDKTN